MRGSTSRRHLDGNCVALILVISAHTLEHLAKGALAQQVAHSIPAPSTQAGRPSNNDRHTASSCTRTPLVQSAGAGRKQRAATGISEVTDRWLATAKAERMVSESVGGVWIDSRQWFCSEGLCPAFVGTTPVKADVRHITAGYAVKISPVMAETFSEAGVF